VGFGKTEVAMRAVFKAVNDSKQGGVLVPTTILAQQHYETFLERFADYPVNIGVLSRFRTPKQIKQTLLDIKRGTLDVVIGTHRILSKDVVFNRLGLLIVDEEHRFGVKHKERVKEINIQDDGVHVNTDKRTYSARYFIDASGRHTLMGKKQTSIKKITNLGRYSLYTHYRKLTSQAAQAMHASGDIKILMLDIGWFWIIPLTNNRMSIGLIVQKNEGLTLKGAELFNHYFQASPFLHKLLEGAEQETSIRTEADFSFTNEKRFGARYACCGDSAGFLDPVFSSGVFIAVNSAERIADRVHQGFKDGTEADPTLHQEDDKAYTLGFRSMQLFVERFYQHDMVHRLFFEETRNDAIEQDITGILSGDLWTDNNAFQKALLGGRQNRKAS